MRKRQALVLGAIAATSLYMGAGGRAQQEGVATKADDKLGEFGRAIRRGIEVDRRSNPW